MGMESISGDILHETEKAIQFAVNGDASNTIWIPKSVVEEGDTDVEDEVDLLISSWFYNKNRKVFEA